MKFKKILKIFSKRKFDSEPACNEIYVKAEIKSYNQHKFS